jgi:aspartate/methionine/tyrosine aminotransferase
LCAPDCESYSIQDLLAFEPDTVDQFHQHRLGYAESQGSPSLQKKICNLYENIAPDNVLVHNGAEEAIYLFMSAVLGAEDHIIVHWPCYQSLFEVARGIGCQVTFWKAHEEKGWALDLDDLQQKIRSNTKAVIINTPHNPSEFLAELIPTSTSLL